MHLTLVALYFTAWACVARSLTCFPCSLGPPPQSFSGNRPSLSIMLPSCTAYTVGQLLALYEHRIAVQVGHRRGQREGEGCVRLLSLCLAASSQQGMVSYVGTLCGWETVGSGWHLAFGCQL